MPNEQAGTRIYGTIGAETMAQHEWVTLEDHTAALSAEIERIGRLEQELGEALAANELDRRNLYSIVRSIDEEITGRMPPAPSKETP